MKIAILLLLAALAPTAQAAEALGRIFYTPEQRAQLDSLRKQRAIVSQARDEPAPETVTYNGIVRRSDGKTVVWMNKRRCPMPNCAAGRPSRAASDATAG